MFIAHASDERWQVLGLLGCIAAGPALVQASQQGDINEVARGYHGDSPQVTLSGAMTQGAFAAFNGLI